MALSSSGLTSTRLGRSFGSKPRSSATSATRSWCLDEPSPVQRQAASSSMSRRDGLLSSTMGKSFGFGVSAISWKPSKPLGCRSRRCRRRTWRSFDSSLTPGTAGTRRRCWRSSTPRSRTSTPRLAIEPGTRHGTSEALGRRQNTMGVPARWPDRDRSNLRSLGRRSSPWDAFSV